MHIKSTTLPGEAPQDPFFPVETPPGPAFLDTAACLCAYRKTPVADSNDGAWECIGNQFDEEINNTKRGKWFRPAHNATITTTSTQEGSAIWDASNPPDTTEPLMFYPEGDALVAFNSKALTVYDAACTGQNQTRFSTAFYRAVSEKENNETMIDAMPCWQGPTAVPMQIMGLDEWQSAGCNEGFLCENNTVNSLPQYCPPVEACQVGRAAGSVCQLNHTNVGMGPFEPVLCQGGYYCPERGVEKISCPARHYCQPGSVRPTPCSVGSSCPKGSISEVFYAPLIALLVFDTLLVLGILLLSLRRRAAKASMGGYAAAYRGLHPPSAQESCRTLVANTTPQEDTFRNVTTPVDSELNQSMHPIESSSEWSKNDGLPLHLEAFVESMRKATETARFGLSFQYTNLSYQPRGTPRPILHNVTGSINCGSLTAIMGGSGAGKSTFINVLMGKLTNTGGSVMINDVPNTMKRYKKLIGYVPQDDIVLPELTVRENILHSARVRLPRHWKDAEVQSHVDTVIDALELSHVQDSLIGTTGRPLISGGQRKRVSIGLELAAAPMAIFLDEPTSGLDATAASSIMRTLRSIACLGISVIVTIHQPRAEIMDMMDEFILLANGQVVCDGAARSVQHYFETLGFSFPPYTNPGDVITDIITGNGGMYKADGNTSMAWLVASWACSEAGRKSNDASLAAAKPPAVSGRRRPFTPSSLIPFTRRASRYRHQSLNDPEILEALDKRGASHLRQMWLCLHRAMLQQWRHKKSFWSEMILASLAGLLLGLAQNGKNGVLFHGIYRGSFAILSPAVDMTSALQLSLLLGVALGLISAGPGVRIFSEEILVQRREAEAGHSRPAYFLAKVVAALPRTLAAAVHFTAVVLFLARLPLPWGVGLAAHLAYAWCAHGAASVVAVSVRREDAPLVATMTSLLLGVLCGAAPTLAQVGRWRLAWLWRAGPAVWLTELYFGELVRPQAHVYRTDLAAAATGLGLDVTARNLGVLVAIGVAYRVVAYAGLVWGTRLRV